MRLYLPQREKLALDKYVLEMVKGEDMDFKELPI